MPPDCLKNARKVCKQAGFIRQAVSRLSKAEETHGTSADERRAIARTFTDNLKAAKDAVALAESDADTCDRAARILRNPSGNQPTAHPTDRKAYACALLGCETTPLMDNLADRAADCRSAADRADTRLTDAHDDIQATLALIDLNEQLPRHGWDINSKALKPAREIYRTHLNAARHKRTTQ